MYHEEEGRKEEWVMAFGKGSRVLVVVVVVRGFDVHAGESLLAVQATPNMGLLIPRNNGNCPMQNGDR